MKIIFAGSHATADQYGLDIRSRRSRTRSNTLDGRRRATCCIEDLEVAELDENQEGMEVGGVKEHRGAIGKVAERQ